MVELLNKVLAKTRDASGLPNKYYTDQKTYLEEREAVFFNNWAALGFAKDLHTPGTVKPFDFLGMPLFAIRDAQGGIQVFQNTCRHRGMILVSEKVKLKGPIRCPYHSWCYDYQGKLVNTPHIGGSGIDRHDSIDPEMLGLFQIRSYVWRDIIFINISGEAPSFEEYAADIMQRWQEFDQPLIHGGVNSSLTFDLATNWKLAVENYCEAYHLPWIHPALNTYSKLEDHYNIDNCSDYSGQGTVVYQQLKGKDGTVFPDFPGLSDKWNTAAEYISFFPNVLLGVHRDHAFAIILEPKGCERTIEHVEFYYSTDLTGNVLQEMVAENTQLWKTVFSEDVGVVEGMQRGRHGIKFDGGKFSPVMDVPTHLFHKWVATQILRAKS